MPDRVVTDEQSSVSVYCIYSLNVENIMQSVGNYHGI
jgi:hypothetical protein